MRDATPSLTAALVALLRSWSRFLDPPLAALAPDPFAPALVGGLGERLDALLGAHPRLARLLLFRPSSGLAGAATFMAVRTRVLDDALLAFVVAGGRQVVVLGAGLDARPLRLAPQLAGVLFLEVDAPASQAAKRAGLARLAASPAALPPVASPSVLVPHDFETGEGGALVASLAAAGLRRDEPVFTLLEGVLVYLSPEAADAALLCARSLSSAPGSQLALTLQTRAPPALGWRRWCRPAGWWGAARPLRRLLLSPWRLAFRAMAAAAGERLRFFFSGPDEAAAWLAQRGFAARWVRDYATLAAGLGVDAAAAPGFALHVASRELAGEVPHIALADRV